MLSDRDYMSGRNSSARGQGGISPNRWVFILIGINVFFFLFVPHASRLFAAMALSTYGIKSLALWQLVTAMFLHDNFGHILLNMWGLYLFGTIVAPVMGSRRFLLLYFISGISGNLFWLLFNWNSPHFLIGASGALFGVLLATAMLEPDRQFLMLFFPVPIKTKTLVVVYAIIEIMSELSTTSRIAHLAHLGGFIGAYIFIKILYGNNVPWDLFGFITGARRKGGSVPRGWKVHSPRKEKSDSEPETGDDTPVSQQELDRLLDKIAQGGINSLSDSEMKRLRRARRQMRG